MLRQAITHSLSLFNRFTLDSATEFLFGSSAHTLGAPLPYAHNSPRKQTVREPHSSDKFANAFGQAQYQIALRTRYTGAWPLFEFWTDKTKTMMRTLYDFIDPILEETLAKKAAGEKNSQEREDGGGSVTLLDYLVEQTDGKRFKEHWRALIHAQDLS